eukprot:tig00021326_g20304.t1
MGASLAAQIVTAATTTRDPAGDPPQLPAPLQTAAPVGIIGDMQSVVNRLLDIVDSQLHEWKHLPANQILGGLLVLMERWRLPPAADAAELLRPEEHFDLLRTAQKLIKLSCYGYFIADADLAFAPLKLAFLWHGSGREHLEIVSHHSVAMVGRPAYFLAINPKMRSICIVVRGTLSASDLLSDLAGSAVPFRYRTEHGGEEREGWAHEGMLRSAVWLYGHAMGDLQRALEQHPTHAVYTAGHSMGGAVAALVAAMLRSGHEAVSLARTPRERTYSEGSAGRRTPRDVPTPPATPRPGAATPARPASPAPSPSPSPSPSPAPGATRDAFAAPGPPPAALANARCFAFCPAALLDLDSARAFGPFVTSFVYNADVVPRLSLQHIEELRRAIAGVDLAQEMRRRTEALLARALSALGVPARPPTPPAPSPAPLAAAALAAAAAVAEGPPPPARALRVPPRAAPPAPLAPAPSRRPSAASSAPAPAPASPAPASSSSSSAPAPAPPLLPILVDAPPLAAEAGPGPGPGAGAARPPLPRTPSARQPRKLFPPGRVHLIRPAGAGFELERWEQEALLAQIPVSPSFVLDHDVRRSLAALRALKRAARPAASSPAPSPVPLAPDDLQRPLAVLA